MTFSLKSTLVQPFAYYIYCHIQKDKKNAILDQDKCLKKLIALAKNTQFGKEHHFTDIDTYADYVQAVPLRDYEAFTTYIHQIKEGKKDVLWKGLPIYFAKTSGTTSGVKYIPITNESIPQHIQSTRNMLFYYLYVSKRYDLVNRKMIFLSGSPALDIIDNIPTGRLSGIVQHHVPIYLQRNNMPSFATNCIEDWEEKVNNIVLETLPEDMSIISGIPPWIQMYFDKLIEKTGKSIATLFPHFQLMVQGGVNFAPYKKRLFESIGKEIDCIEIFPASEGVFAFSLFNEGEGLWLNTNADIFYEFVPLKEYHLPNRSRKKLSEVVIDEYYAMIISTNAGLWGYELGDTIKFVSLNPYKIVVTGRVKQFISAFGEHVIAKEVEDTIAMIIKEEGVKIVEFTVAPFIAQEKGKSYHEWYIEFEMIPHNIEYVSLKMDTYLRKKNVYYDDLLRGNILIPLHIRCVKKDGFKNYLHAQGKLGGQNKIPRLANDRTIVDGLTPFCYEL